MLRLILGRLATGVPTLLAVSLLVFAIVRFIPGDPARLLAGDFATDQVVEELRARWRLNDPLPVQYVAYVGGLLHGDFGRSITTSTPVLPELVERFLRTLELAVAGIVLAAVVGGAAGIVSAVRRASLTDYVATALALAGISTPIFWSGLLLILLFSVRLEWLPAGGTGTLRHLVLPAVTLAAAPLAQNVRLIRAGMLEVLAQDYVRTAYAKGVGEAAVVYRHALRNAAIPVITVSGLSLGFMLSGTIIIETVFAWPGLGRLIVQAVPARDFPVIQAAVFLFAVVFVVINLLVDVLYTVADPRVRLT